ncbi:cytochrome P450 71AU50-like [Salvia divinorum]|uniref:Cytochrome P450 71AU50-like n=1 Tax=Salvia divinorum TaxID=28513 RepID=A0ABD1IGZ6_SALDI
MAVIWLVLSVIVFIYFLQQQLGPRNKKRLPPGPKGLPILGHLHLLGKNPHRDLYRLARKHGPIMGLRLGFVPAVVVSSPAAAELVLKTHDLIFASRPTNEASVYVAYDQRNLAFGPYGPFWRDMRKLCTLKLLSNLKISQFQHMRRAEVGLLVTYLKRAAESREAVDLSARVAELNGDMNFLMVFGKKYSTMEEKGFKDVNRESMEIVGKFNLADYFQYVGVLNLQGLHGKMKRLSKVFDGILEEIIDDHMKKQQQQRVADLVDTMMEIMESGQAGFEFDRRHVKAVLLDMIIAGMDTSSTALEWAMSELMKNPATVSSKASSYQKKARVIVNVWAIGRDPDVWANPDSFTPERFVGSEIDLRGRHFELLPFGSGRRGCPGLQLGLTVVKLVLAQLVHCFDWELPDGMMASEVDMAENFGLVTARAEPLVAVPICRLHKY